MFYRNFACQIKDKADNCRPSSSKSEITYFGKFWRLKLQTLRFRSIWFRQFKDLVTSFSCDVKAFITVSQIFLINKARGDLECCRHTQSTQKYGTFHNKLCLLVISKCFARHITPYSLGEASSDWPIHFDCFLFSSFKRLLRCKKGSKRADTCSKFFSK